MTSLQAAEPQPSTCLPCIHSLKPLSPPHSFSHQTHQCVQPTLEPQELVPNAAVGVSRGAAKLPGPYQTCCIGRGSPCLAGSIACSSSATAAQDASCMHACIWPAPDLACQRGQQLWHHHCVVPHLAVSLKERNDGWWPRQGVKVPCLHSANHVAGNCMKRSFLNMIGCRYQQTSGQTEKCPARGCLQQHTLCEGTTAHAAVEGCRVQKQKQAPGWAGYPLASSMAELWLVWCWSWAKAWEIVVRWMGWKEASMLCLLASWRRTLPATPSIRALRGLQAAGRVLLRGGKPGRQCTTQRCQQLHPSMCLGPLPACRGQVQYGEQCCNKQAAQHRTLPPVAFTWVLRCPQRRQGSFQLSDYAWCDYRNSMHCHWRGTGGLRDALRRATLGHGSRQTSRKQQPPALHSQSRQVCSTCNLSNSNAEAR